MRNYLLVLCTIVIMFSCRDKVICPAFQSTYILDDSVRMVYYSYLWKIDEQSRTKYLADRRAGADTSITASVLKADEVDYFAYVEPHLVPEREVNKSRYGIVKYEPYWLKQHHMRTAPKENLLSPPPPELMIAEDEGELLASDFFDSLSISGDSISLALKVNISVDSTSIGLTDTIGMADTSSDSLSLIDSLILAQEAAPPAKPQPPKFLYRYDPKDSLLNVEQLYYNKYFGKYLVDTRKPKPKKEELPGKKSLLDSAAMEEGTLDSLGQSQGKKGFFSRRKNQEEENQLPEESVETPDVPLPEADLPVEESSPPVEEALPPEEDEGDGF